MKRIMKKLFSPLRKKTAAHNKGFTLLEILVVLTIMGFPHRHGGPPPGRYLRQCRGHGMRHQPEPHDHLHVQLF